MSAVHVARDVGTAGDVDLALCNAPRCIRSRKGRTVDGANVSARDLCRVLRRIPVFRTHLGTVGIGDCAAGDGDGVLLRIARRERVAASVKLVVLHKSAVRRRTDRAARNGQLVVLHFVADLGASCPAFRMCAVRCGIGRRTIVLKLIPFERDVLRRIRRMAVGIDDVFKFVGGAVLCTRIARRRNARRVVNQLQPIRLVGLDARTRKARCIHFELIPLEPRGLAAVVQCEQGIRRIDGAVQVELDLVKVRDVPRRRVGLDVQNVVRDICLIAAVDDTIDGRSDCTLPVAKVDGVARSRTRSCCVAAVDIAHRAARDGNGVACGIACRCRICQRSTIDSSIHGAGVDDHFILCRTARFGLDLGTIGVRCLCTRVQDECVLLGIARSARDGGVFDHAAAYVQCRTAARERQLVFLHFVADDGASAPRIRGCRARIACIIVLEAVALEVDFRGCGTVAVRCHVRLVVVRMDAPARARIAVARAKVDVAAVLHERQDAVACRVCRETVEVIDVELVPIEGCGISVIQRQEDISRCDVAARCLEVHLVKVRNVARSDTVVDIQRVVRRSRIAAAVELSDGGARSNGIGLAAEVHGVARRLTGTVCKAAVDITHRAARDGDNVAHGIACCRGMGKIAAVHGAADTAA